jgi:nitrate reductase NapE component
MAGNPNILVCVAAPFTVCALLCIAISFATESWQHFDVTLPDGYVGSKEFHFSRKRGLFRTCFDGADTEFLERSPYIERVTDNTCLKDRGLPFDGPDSNVPDDDTRGHILRLEVALIALGIFFLFVSAFVGGFGCLKKRGRWLYATAVFNFAGGFITALGVALFHVVLYFEDEKVRIEPYPASWTQIVFVWTETRLHYSYVLGWVGAGLAIIAGILYTLAGREIRRMKKKEKRKLMPYHHPQHGPHGPHYPMGNPGYEHYPPPQREYGYPHAPPSISYEPPPQMYYPPYSTY